MWWPFKRRPVNVFNALRYPVTELTYEQLNALPPEILFKWWKTVARCWWDTSNVTLLMMNTKWVTDPKQMVSILDDGTNHHRYLKSLQRIILEWEA